MFFRPHFGMLPPDLFQVDLSSFLCALRAIRVRRVSTALLLWAVLAIAGVSLAQTAVISPAGAFVHANSSQKFKVAVTGAPNPNGSWYVLGGIQNGYLEQDGTYHAPNVVPSPANITFGFVYNGSNNYTTQQLTITNPVPVVNSTSPATFTSLNFNLLLYGASLIPGGVVTVQGKTYTNVSYQNGGGQLYIPDVTLNSPPITGTIPVVVTNPDPGTSSTTFDVPSIFPVAASVTPSILVPGWNTVMITGSGFTPGSIVTLDGRPMQTSFSSPTFITGYGYEPGWKTGTSVIGVIPSIGAPSESNTTLRIRASKIPYDTAARFATQAAMGPRPDIVEHIQQIGLQAFITEQVSLPGVTYSPNDSPRFDYMHGTLQSNVSLLRLRVAAALNSYIPNQAIFLEYQSFVPWEEKLEADATGNYRQILADIASDPRLGNFLALAGNDVSVANPNLHPTQNFARELMQLFSLGTSQLDDDGSVRVDSNDQPLPSYDQNTVLDLSRALTGWDLPTPANPMFTAFLIDESQLLTPVEANHDHGAKTLFGTVNLPAGQSVTQDRDQALDAIFNQPSLPPFVSKILIHHLVTSNPSPAYVQRVVNAFKNNGSGIRGDLTAVLTAILLDKEARAGDKTPNANDGFLQDPQLFQLFATSALQDPGLDTQQIYLGSQLGQNWWHPNTVFDFYPQAGAIPGTTINSPEFTLLNNSTVLKRSQILYGIVSGTIPGFDTEYQASSWLFNAFTNVPDLVDGLNHLLYHGQMSAAEQTAITEYCVGIPNQQQAFTYAVFLALNADGFGVSH